MRIVKEFAEGLTVKSTIITDDIQTRLGTYILGFDKEDNVNFISWDDFKGMQSGIRYLMILNPYTSYIGKQEMPYYAEMNKNEAELLLKDSLTSIEIYEIDRIPEKEILLESSNDFEAEYPYWRPETQYSDEVVKNGSWSNKALEFSSTFQYGFDSLFDDRISSLLVSVQFQCLYRKMNKTRLVVVLESEGAEYHRTEKDFMPYIKSIDHWWKVEQQIFIHRNDIRKNSKIVLYLWDPEKREKYIDDFAIVIETIN